MKISVVIPVYNSERTLRSCLESIKKSNVKPFETIIIDDGSTDNSIEIAKEFNFRIIKLKKNSGPAVARNTGVRNAKGDVILFIDSDVVIPNNVIQKVVNDFKKEKVDAVQGIYSVKQRYNNKVSQYQQSYYCYQYLSIKNEFVGIFNTFFCAIKKDVFNKLNGFNEGIPRATVEDTEFGYLLIKNGHKIYLDKSIQVEHLINYSLVRFIKRRFFMSRDLMMSYLRINQYKKPKNIRFQEILHTKISTLISVFITPIIILNILLLEYYYFRYSFVFFMVLFVLLNLDFWIFIYKNGKYLFTSIFLTFLDRIFTFLGVFIGLIEYLILNRKY